MEIRFRPVAFDKVCVVMGLLDITGHKTHAMLCRCSHSDDALRRETVEHLERPKPAATVVALRVIDKPAS